MGQETTLHSEEPWTQPGRHSGAFLLHCDFRSQSAELDDTELRFHRETPPHWLPGF